jgi:hypothetical protein
MFFLWDLNRNSLYLRNTLVDLSMITTASSLSHIGVICGGSRKTGRIPTCIQGSRNWFSQVQLSLHDRGARAPRRHLERPNYYRRIPQTSYLPSSVTKSDIYNMRGELDELEDGTSSFELALGNLNRAIRLFFAHPTSINLFLLVARTKQIDSICLYSMEQPKTTHLSLRPHF